ncbi:retropepsin-like aspartic protease [Winogradskyella ursingii]|uniref:retropepsin-like aspartic protease n=1 Tax=Winogradskyella ursingii TaxID=2686079 RepID=UPI0015CD91AC|nr:aspartyl protease family protein [Winogradskyella ursingii]
MLKALIKYSILCFTVFFVSYGNAQGTAFLKDKVSEKIDFELIGNLVLIPIEVNGVKLSFLLDTGVSRPILFNLSDRDSLSLKNVQTFYLHGLGAEGKIEALKSQNNRFKLGNVNFNNKDLYVLYDESINFTPRLGVLVHGIIGFDIFEHFVVEVNYSSKYLRLHKPQYFNAKSSKKWKTVPIEIHKKKPYVDAKVNLEGSVKDVKLLIDTGSSDALWLFEDENKNILPNENYMFHDFLGKGLSGSVYGKRSKVNNFNIVDFSIPKVNVAFPDSVSVNTARVYEDRNGSVGGDVLKRFNYYFDYGNKKLHLKKNGLFKKPFTYNNSGIVLEYNGFMFVKERIRASSLDSYGNKTEGTTVQINESLNYMMSVKPAYKIVEIRSSSNAYKSGLMVGDVLINVNGKPAYNFKLPELNKVFHDKTGKTIKLKINRNGVDMLFKFKLDNALKRSEPLN